MATLSEKEAEKIVNDIAPLLREKTKRGKDAVLPIASFAEWFGPVMREGNTPDVYCKIARAASEHELSVGIKASTRHGMVFVFNTAKQGYKKPSPSICVDRWRRAKKNYELNKSEYGEEFAPILPPYEPKK